MMGTLPVLTGCEDSEKEEQLTTVEASGRFATKLLMDIGNGKLLHQEIPSTVVTISPETATTVKLQFSAFSVDVQQGKAPLHGADVQSFTVPGVQLKKEADGSFTLSGSPQFTTLMRLGMGNAPRQSAQFKEYKATESSLQGTLKNGVLHLNLTFKPGSCRSLTTVAANDRRSPFTLFPLLADAPFGSVGLRGYLGFAL